MYYFTAQINLVLGGKYSNYKLVTELCGGGGKNVSESLTF